MYLQPGFLRALPHPCPPPGPGTAASGSVLRATILRAASAQHHAAPLQACGRTQSPGTTTAAFLLQTRGWGLSSFLPRPRSLCRDAAEPGKPRPLQSSASSLENGLASSQTIHPAATFLSSKKIPAVVPWSLREGGCPWEFWGWQGWARAHKKSDGCQGPGRPRTSPC